MESETDIWAVVQNPDGTMESPFYELEPATHMENRLTTPPSPPRLQEMGVRRGGCFLLPCYVYSLCPCHPYQSLPLSPHKTGLIWNAPAMFMQGWDSVTPLILTLARRETQGPSLRGRLARPSAF